MDAELMAMGGYDAGVADCLEYPASWYDGVARGAVVFSSLFACPTSGASRRLAGCLGMDDPCDLGRAAVELARADREALAELADEIGCAEDLARLARLEAAGFAFYYRPNA